MKRQAHKPPGIAYNVVFGVLIMLGVLVFIVVLFSQGKPT